MSTQLQTIIIGAIAGLAFIYLLRRVYVAFFTKKEGCSSGCGCAATELKKQIDLKK